MPRMPRRYIGYGTGTPFVPNMQCGLVVWASCGAVLTLRSRLPLRRRLH